MTESDFSNVIAATPIDTVPPVITHTPLTAAAPGMPLTILADVTDNVRVQGVTLYFRKIGVTSYTSRAMVFTTGNRYTATIEGSLVSSPGLEYYLTAYDGVSTVTMGRPENPYQVAVVDRPIITTVTPARGPDSGGTPVTIAGSNFKAGATVTFGGRGGRQCHGGKFQPDHLHHPGPFPGHGGRGGEQSRRAKRPVFAGLHL